MKTYLLTSVALGAMLLAGSALAEELKIGVLATLEGTYTVLGEDADQQATAQALESAKGLLRSEVGKQLGMRHVPSLAFEFDGVPEIARHLDEVLAKAREADAAVAAAREGAQPAGEADPYKKPREIVEEEIESDD